MHVLDSLRPFNPVAEFIIHPLNAGGKILVDKLVKLQLNNF